MRSRTTFAILLAGALTMSAAAQVAPPNTGGGDPGAGAPPPGPPPRGPKPPFDPNAPEALLRLQQAELELQGQILGVQETVLETSKGGKPPSPDDPRLQELRQLDRRLILMRAQTVGLVQRLPPPDLMPPGVARDLAAQRDQIHDQMVKIRETMTALKNALREGGDKLPVPQDPDKPQPPPDHPLPTTSQEAGQAINRGAVKSPRSLIETFMQIPDQQVSKSNLNYYRTKVRR